MSSTFLAERIRVESQILNHIREALLVALNAEIDELTGEQWTERCRFLTESFERHVLRLFRIKWEVDDAPLLLNAEQPGLEEELATMETEQRALAYELHALTHESRQLAIGNVANLHAFKQRLLGYMERFEDMRLREYKIWLDACDVDIGGEA